MSEKETILLPRAMKAAIEFNVSKDTLVEFLGSKGFSADDMQRDFKLSEQMYRVLQSEFQQDKVAKQKAEQIDLPKGAGSTEPKRKRDEEDLSFKKKEASAAPAPVVEVPVVEKPVEETQSSLFDVVKIPNILSIKLASLELLNLELNDFKTKTEESSKEISKFVKEGTVTESSIIEQLKDAVACFK